MSAMDVDALLAELSVDAPCGEDLEYDLAFAGMERAAQGKPEQQFGQTIVPAEDPDWRELKRQGLEVLARTKDLRVMLHVARAVLSTDGLTAFCDCLAVLRGYIERYWDGVHPRLDPDDDNDPTMRVNTLVSLCDADTTLRMLRKAVLVSSLRAGRFSLLDIETASGEVPPPAGTEAPKMSTIEAAFTDCDLGAIQSLAAAVRRGIDDAVGLESSLTAQVGVSKSASFKPLVDQLRRIEKILAVQLTRRGAGGAVAEDGAGAGSAAGPQGQMAGAVSNRLSGDITSREDVTIALDKICAYYERYEPSSPLPLLLKRAKRLATKSFMEIIRDLAPDGLGQAQSIGGITEGGEGESS